MTIYLQDATYIDWKTGSFKTGHMKVEEGVNDSVSFIDRILVEKNPENKIINCKGKLVTKSFACAHHHIYSALARGMRAPKKPIENFHDNLKYIWWTLDKSLTRDMVYASALVTALYCAKNGVTFVIDHHSSPYALEGVMHIIADAFDEAGLGHLLCIEMSDRDDEKVRDKALSETKNYLRTGKQGLVGLHASFTVSDYLMNKAFELAATYDSGIHIHVAEDMIDQQLTQKEYGLRVIERLDKHGVLDLKKTILAHCLHIDDVEKKMLQQKQPWIVANIESNMKNRVGFFNGQELHPNIMLGTDGMHSDMLRSGKAAWLVGMSQKDGSMHTMYHRFRNVHHYLNANSFRGDGDNNLVILEYDTPTDINEENFLSHFFFGFENRHICDVISQGRLIVSQGDILTLQEDDILDYAKELARKLWKRMDDANYY